MFLALAALSPVIAGPTLPQGGAFVAGSGTIGAPANGSLSITQTSNRGVINWSGFSVGTGGQVTINNGSGATLNRVTGGSISTISGRLSATGSVYLVNPNGVVVDSSGKVLTGGSFVASTRDIATRQFMKGGAITAEGKSSGKVVNEGSITAQNGDVVLIGHAVENGGEIKAAKGTATLAAADRVLMTTVGGPAGVYVAPDVGSTGDVTQSGRIEAAAAGLKSAGGNVYTMAGNRTGLVTATGTKTVDGEIWLTAPNGAVSVNGSITARNAVGSGGRIVANGSEITIHSDARLAATGDKGGTVLVGVSAPGGKNLARTTTVASGASIQAGGSSGGGFVETSGHKVTIGKASIAAGKGGEWRVDPVDLTIDADAAATIAAALDAGSDVTEMTDATSASGSGAQSDGLGDIIVAAPITWTGLGGLTLNAYHDIQVNAAISGGGSFTGTAGATVAVNNSITASAISLLANTGDIVVAATLTMTGAARSNLSAFRNLTINDAVSAAGSFTAIAGNALAVNNTIDAADISLGAADIVVGGAVTWTGPGASIFNATHDLTITAAVSGVGSFSGIAGNALSVNNTINAADISLGAADITVGGAVTWTGLGASSFNATHDLTITAAVSGAGSFTGLAGNALSINNPIDAANVSLGASDIVVGGAVTWTGLGASSSNATHDLTINAAVSGVGSFSAIAGNALAVNNTINAADVALNAANIVVGGAVTWIGPGASIFDATNDLTINGVITGTGGLTATAGNSLAVGANLSAANISLTATAGALTVGPGAALTSPSTVSLTSAGALTLETGATVNGDAGVTLTTTGAFVNHAGAGVLSSPSGRWLVYSDDPANDTAGGLTPDFYQYAAPGGTLPAEAGNGLLFALAPTVTLSLIGTLEKTYDGTTAAVITGANESFSGLSNGDTAVVTSGSYGSKNAGNAVAVTASGLVVSHDGIAVYGYGGTSASVTADIGKIDPAELTAAIIGDPTKIYNGTTSAILNSANYLMSGFIGGEGASVNQPSSVAYDLASAGPRTVNATFSATNFVANSGTILSNYSLPASASGIGTISPAPILIQGAQATSKTYDGTTNDTLVTTGLSLYGIIGSDNVQLVTSGATGSFASPNVGSGLSVSASGFDLSGTKASNYALVQPTGLTASISAKGLTVSGVTAIDKSYDGTRTSMLNVSGATLGGVIGSDDVSLVGSATGQFATADVGSAIAVSVSGLSLTGAGHNNYSLAQPGGVAASITPQSLGIAILGNPTKTYNGDDTAVLSAANYLLTGFVGTESASVNQTSLVTYDSANAGPRTITALLAPSDYTAGSGTKLSNYALPTLATGAGTISTAPVTIQLVGNPSKTYDGTTDATVSAGNFVLSGFLAGQGATVTQSAGTYSSPNAGIRQVTVALGEGDLTPNGGTLLTNYSLPAIITGFGTIWQASLGGSIWASITGNPTKTYDGSTSIIIDAANFTLSGFVGDDGAVINRSITGALAGKDAGVQPLTANLIPSDFTAAGSTDLANYTLPSIAYGMGTVDPANVAITIVNSPTKIYNGTATATLASSNYDFTGLVAGESLIVASAVHASYDGKVAGVHNLTASFALTDITAGSGTLLSNYILPTDASGTGQIDQAPLVILNVRANNKTYNASTTAGLSTGGAYLFGAVASDDVSLSTAGAAATFASPNAGSSIAVTAAGFSLTGGDSANYIINQPSGLSATIYRATVNITGLNVTSKYYDNTNVATLGGAPILSGVLGADAGNVLLNGASTSATFGQVTVGSNMPVTVSGFTLTGSAISNYYLNQPSGLRGDINAAPLTVTVVGNPTKTYDGSASTTLTQANFQLSGFVSGQGAHIPQSARVDYDSADAGSQGITATLVSSDYFANSGTNLSNYALPSTVTGTGTITPAPLTISLIGNPSKVYDATTAATLISTNYKLGGFLPGQSATVTQTSGIYASANVGTPIVTASLSSGDYTAGSGTNLNNYNLPIIASGAGTISRAQLHVVSVFATSKIYDGNTSDSLNTASGAVSGLQGLDSVTLDSSGASAVFASKDVGTGIGVTATGFTIGGGASSNYTLLQPVGLAAEIAQKTLTLTKVQRVYDANTDLPVSAGSYTLSGMIGADTVTVNTAGITGSYGDKNVGSGKSLSLTGLVLAGSSAGNYTIASSLTNAMIGRITVAPLAVTGITVSNKIYDGTNTATLSAAGAAFSGLLGSDDVALVGAGATGVFGNKNVGTGKTVTASGYTISGTDAANYSFGQPTGIAADITPYTGLTLFSVTKTYDGNTNLPVPTSAYVLHDVIGSDDVTVTGTGSFSDKNVAGNLTVSGSFTLSGTDAGNYQVGSTFTDSAVGIINAKSLVASIIGTPTKTYDRTTSASLSSGNFVVSGFVGGEGATVTQTSGTYAGANAGNVSVTASLTGGDFTANGATLLGNYVLPTSASGSGRINAKALTISGVMATNKLYDANTSDVLNVGTAALVGVVAGDEALVSLNTGAANGIFASDEIGSWAVTASGFAISGGKASNYTLSQPIGLSANIGNAVLQLTSVIKTYDATDAVTGAGVSYVLSGYIGGESVTVDTTNLSGAYADTNVGSAIGVTLTGLALSGADASHYVIANSLTDVAIGTINKKSLSASVTGTPTKTYDGNTGATLVSGDFTVSGFVGGQGVTVTKTAGTYANSHAGNKGVTVSLAGGDFTSDSGTALSNYVLPTLATGTGQINTKALAISVIGNPTKTYNANTTATLNSGNYSLSGFVGSESATVTETWGTYGAANAGSQTVTVNLTGSDFTAGGATSLSDYLLPTVATGAGNISQKSLTAWIVNSPVKTYDSTIAASVAAGDYSISGFVGTDGATVSKTAGTYASATAGTKLITVNLASDDITATGSTNFANYILPSVATGNGTINKKGLTISVIGTPTKAYDGTMATTLAAGNYSLSGFIGADGATVTKTLGTYSSANAGTPTVTVSLVGGDYAATGGANFSNYTLPTTATGAGLINTKTLTIAIIGTPTKTYDATTAATLASGNYSISGFAGAEGATVTQTVGTYALADAGAEAVSTNLVAGNFTATGGANFANYVLPTTAGGAGIINTKAIVATIIGTPTKTYDANTAIALASGNYALSGFIGSDAATVTKTTGTYVSANAGNETVTASLVGSDFIAGGATNFANYALPVSASGTGHIDQKSLSVSITGTPTKTYNANATATLVSGHYTLTGFIGADGVTVTKTSGIYAGVHVGDQAVSVTLAGGDFTGTGGALLANYILPTTAAGTGHINAKTLTASIIGSPAKTFDATTVATLAAGNYSIAGFLGAEGATVSKTSGTYASALAGTRVVTVNLAGGDFTATGVTQLTDYVLPTVATGNGTINKKGLTISVIGTPTKTYDGTMAATLAAGNYTLSGFIGADGATVTNVSGTYASAVVGDRTVTVSLAGGDYSATGGANLANYTLPITATGLGHIDPKTLTISIINTPTKTYDSITAATLASLNYSIVGFVGTDGATVTQTSGSYASPDAGNSTVSTTLVAGNFTATGATDFTNYGLPTAASGTGHINAKAITVAIIGTPTKIYDGNPAIALASGNYSLSGFIASDGAVVTKISATYASANAGAELVTASLVVGDYTATGATNFSNYVLPGIVTGLGQINQKAVLSASITGTPTKAYDGTTVATLVSTDYTLLGFIGSESVSVTKTSGTYSGTHIGDQGVTVTLTGGDFSAGSGTLLANYDLPTSASGTGHIDPKVLTASITASPTKTYDGNTDSMLTSGNYALTGFASGEGATVTHLSGTYAGADVGNEAITANLAAGDFTVTGSTDFTDYVLPTHATGMGRIDPKALAVTITGTPLKTYDGNTTATLASGDYALTGFIGSESASIIKTSGVYVSANVGDEAVTSSLTGSDFLAGGGTNLANYVLPISAGGTGHINQKTLTASIIGTPTKTYDATTAATLASGNYSILGFIGVEGATVNQTAGIYAIADAGDSLVSTTLASGNFAATGSTDLGNYVLPVAASGTGHINAKAVSAAIIGTPTKIYDGNTTATLGSGNYSLSGFIGVDGTTVGNTAGIYVSANAGNEAVTASLVGGDFTATGATNLANYVLPVTASGTGHIDQKALSASVTGTPTKSYNGNTTATLVSGDYTLSGFVGIQGATVTKTSGTYAGVHAGDQAVSVTLAGGDFTPTGGALLANYVLPTTAAGTGHINAKTLTASIIGSPAKTYDATAAATLAAGNYSIAGFVGAEGATVSKTSGTYASALAGTRVVTVNLVGGDFTATGVTLLTDYVLPSVATGNGTINKKGLTISVIGTPTKTYDAMTAATLAAGNYSLSGFIGADGANVTKTTGTYSSANAGTPSVTVSLAGGDFTATGGANLGNYTLPITATGAGLINLKMLTTSIVGTPAKTYDGTTAATLASGNYSISGFAGAQGATVTQTTGTYAAPDAGSQTVTTSLVAGNFSATGGANFANYVLPTSASGTGTINTKMLTASIVATPTKIYDGMTAATLGSANYSISGFVATDGATVGKTTGTYASANAGGSTVSTSLAGGDFTVTGSTNFSNYVLPTTASGAGLINAKTLFASVTGTPTKTYDGNMAGTLAAGDYTLSGFIGSEGATVTKTSGGYAGSHAGDQGISVSLTGTDFAATGGALLTNYVLPATASGIGHINAKTLTASIVGTPAKTYDGDATAALVAGNYSIAGFVGGEGATVTQTSGTYAGVSAGSRTVTAALTGPDFAATGSTDFNDYVLPILASGAGTINKKGLTTSVIGTPTKTYDGSTAAILVSGNYSVSGFVGSDGALVMKTTGGYAAAAAGNESVTASLIVGDYSATGGADLNNYTLPTVATGAGYIDQKALTIAIIGIPTKTYDGITAATLASGNYLMSGFVGIEDATVTKTTGSYAVADAGDSAVSTSLIAGNFTATGSTDLSNYVLPMSAGGTGHIDAKMVTVSIIGTPTKTYDGTTVAPLDTANYSLSGFVDSDGATVTQASGTYLGANAGNQTVTAGLSIGDFIANGSTNFSNYVLPVTAAGNGHVDQRVLTAAITGTPTKTYDGDTTATLASGDYTLYGFVGAQGASVTKTAGLYVGTHAGDVGVTVSLTGGDFTATGGALFANYVLPTVADGTGHIDPKSLSISIVGTPTKIYDGNTSANLTSGNYALTGFVGSEGATVSHAADTYAGSNAGDRTVTASLLAGDFTGTGSTLLADYVLPLTASGAGHIDQKQLAATISGTPTKTYDGGLGATLVAGDYTINGFVAVEGASVIKTSGSYASAASGDESVSASLSGSDFSASGGTNLANYILPVGASGTGHIDPKVLTAAVSGTPTKTYDGNAAATLVAADYALFGFITGEGATVTQVSGMFGSAHAGDESVTANLGAGDFTAQGATNLSNYVLPISAAGAGHIDAKSLVAAISGTPTKIYDGNSAATVSAVDFTLWGFVAGQNASVTQVAGIYSGTNAGGEGVTVSLASGDFSATGTTDLADYVLPVSASGTGRIDRKVLTAAITGTPLKTYDGNTAATLASADYTLYGFVSGEGASITKVSGTYLSADAGNQSVNTVLGAGDLTAAGTTSLANYILPTAASGIGHIDPKQLTLIITGAPVKTYDGTTVATLASSDYTLTGFVAVEGAHVIKTLGSYAASDAGDEAVSATLSGTDFAADTGTRLANYILPVAAAGTGHIDSKQLTATITGMPIKTYDATTAATLASSDYTLYGFVSGEGAVVTQVSGTYAGAHSGDESVTAMLSSGDFAAQASTSLANYVLPVLATGTGHIDPKQLAAAIVGTPAKTYDGTASQILVSANYTLGGFIGGDSAMVTQTVATFDVAHAGSRTVTAQLLSGDFSAGGGTDLSNYALPTTASGAGRIDAKQLTASVSGTPLKTYDGTTGATLAASDYTLIGFISGEGAQVTQMSGIYADTHAGDQGVSANLGAGDFAASGMTDLANYVLPVFAMGSGHIDTRTVSASIIGTPVKTYDGNTAAALTASDYALYGFVAGEGATVTKASGGYANADAGDKAVSAVLAASDFNAGASTDLSNYVLPATASGTGHIDAKSLAIAITGTPVKIYDGNTSAILSASDYALSGFIAGEGASVTLTSGAYGSVHAGDESVTALLTSGDFTAESGTRLANYILPAVASGTGHIDARQVSAAITGTPAKTYDGNTAAVLTASDYTLSGFVIGEGAAVTQSSGTYSGSHAGDHGISVTLSAGDFLAAGSTDLTDYALPVSAAGTGRIAQKQLVAAITGTATKTYDGTISATLVSGDYALSGFVAGERARVTQTAAAYDSADAGARSVTARLSAGDFTADNGTRLSDYVLPLTAMGAGDIDPKHLFAAISGTPGNIYDGNTAVALVASDYTLTGFITGEGATVTRAAGTYADANAGSQSVSVTLQHGDFDAGQGTNLANYILPAIAMGTGRIDPRQLSVGLVGASKTYDGTLSVSLTASNFTLSGFAERESASVTRNAASFESPDAGTRTVSTSLHSADFLFAEGTRSANYILPTLATGDGVIDRKALSAAIVGLPGKTYDGTSAATLSAGNFAIAGFASGEGVTVRQTGGAYASADAGTQIVSASLSLDDFAANGTTNFANYVLPAAALGDGRIDPRSLQVAIVGTPTRMADETTLAHLTSANYALSGFVLGQGATVTQTAGHYDSAADGERTVTATLTMNDFTTNAGTWLANYRLPANANGAGLLTPAVVTNAPTLAEAITTNLAIATTGTKDTITREIIATAAEAVFVAAAPRTYVPSYTTSALTTWQSNGFGLLPTIVDAQVMSSSPSAASGHDGDVVSGGLSIINTPEQGLLQGDKNKNWRIMFQSESAAPIH